MMTGEEVGCYIRLLCHAWESDGLVPDQKKLSILTQCSSNAVASVVKDKFKLDEKGILRNYRLETERSKIADMSEKNSKKATRRWALPQSDEAKRIAAIFHRSLTTEWSKKEITAFKSAGKIDPDDLALLERFYTANRHNEKAFLRTGLQAFCNNFRGELDKARMWAQRNPRSAAAANPHGGNGTHEPPEFRQWLSAQYPDKAELPWADVPQSVRKQWKLEGK